MVVTSDWLHQLLAVGWLPLAFVVPGLVLARFVVRWFWTVTHG